MNEATKIELDNYGDKQCMYLRSLGRPFLSNSIIRLTSYRYL